MLSCLVLSFFLACFLSLFSFFPLFFSSLFSASLFSDPLLFITPITCSDTAAFAVLLLLQGLAREWVNRVQKLRKSGGLLAADRIEVFYEPIANEGAHPRCVI
eukprot:COSAG06_NODE_855_length_11931_cov_20.218813_5_plen_103_part_00